MIEGKDTVDMDLERGSSSAQHPDVRLEHQRPTSSTFSAEKPKAFTFWRGVLYFWYLPYNLSGHFMSADLSARYRRHLVWAKDDGEKLLQVVTSRFQITTVILSLLVASDLAVLYSPSQVVHDVREAMAEGIQSFNLKFFIGISLSFSILISVSALIANFTAWSIFIVLSAENAPIILRSSLGLYSAQLPSRLTIIAIYSFFFWIALFFFDLLPFTGAMVLALFGVCMIGHIASTYSAVGQVIMATSAMSSTEIMPQEDAEKLNPAELYAVLVQETFMAKKANIPINKQYRMDYRAHLYRQENLQVPFSRHRRRKRKAMMSL